VVRLVSPLLLLTAVGGWAQTATEVSVSIVAVQARHAGGDTKTFGPGLDDVKTAIEGLDFDSFTKVKGVTISANSDDETSVAINDAYTLFLKCLSRGKDGRVKLEARIELTPKKAGAAPVTALRTELTMAPGKHVNLGGLRLDEGELILVLRVAR
jgi:hypothetical protein